MKSEKEQELELRIKCLISQIGMERKAYHLLFTKVSDLVGKKVNEGIFEAIERFRKAISDAFSDLINKKIGNMKLNEAVNDAITKFGKEIQNDKKNS